MSAGTDDDGGNGPPYRYDDIPERVREEILDGRPPEDLQLIEKRFWTKTRDDDGSECIEWDTPARTGRGHDDDGENTGYGGFWYGGANVAAHKVAHELVEGDIPEDKQLNHRCDNVLCVLPAHLYEGTQADNIRDKFRRERASIATLTHDDVREIRERYDEGDVSQRDLAGEYGVEQTTICDVVNRITFDYID